MHLQTLKWTQIKSHQFDYVNITKLSRESLINTLMYSPNLICEYLAYRIVSVLQAVLALSLLLILYQWLRKVGWVQSPCTVTRMCSVPKKDPTVVKFWNFPKLLVSDKNYNFLRPLSGKSYLTRLKKVQQNGNSFKMKKYSLW